MEERAAHPAAPGARLGHDVLGSGERGAGQRLEALVERDVHGVDESGDLGEVLAPVGLRLPDARAVGVQGYAELAGRLGQGGQVVPRREQAAAVAQRQLDQGGPEAGREPAEVVGGGGDGPGR